MTESFAWRQVYRSIRDRRSASAALIGIVVLHQIPAVAEGIGIVLVMGGVALHKARDLLPQSESPLSKNEL